MTIAVFNAAGAQAKAIAIQVERAGFAVRRLSRTPAPGRHVVDTSSEDAIARALDGADAAVFTIPQDYRAGAREDYAERVTRAAAQAGLRRLVVNAGGPVFETMADPMGRELRAIRGIFLSGAVPTVILQPTSFLDNLSEPWSAPAIVEGGVLAYPIPPELEISWVSHRSLGDFVAAALRSQAVDGRIIDIGGPAPLTGPQIAAAVGRAAGRAVRFEELPLDAFAAALDQAFGAPAGERVAALLAHYRDHPRDAVRDPADWAPLDVRPEPLDQWAQRQQWRAAVQA